MCCFLSHLVFEHIFKNFPSSSSCIQVVLFSFPSFVFRYQSEVGTSISSNSSVICSVLTWDSFTNVCATMEQNSNLVAKKLHRNPTTTLAVHFTTHQRRSRSSHRGVVLIKSCLHVISCITYAHWKMESRWWHVPWKHRPASHKQCVRSHELSETVSITGDFSHMVSLKASSGWWNVSKVRSGLLFLTF